MDINDISATTLNPTTTVEMPPGLTSSSVPLNNDPNDLLNINDTLNPTVLVNTLNPTVEIAATSSPSATPTMLEMSTPAATSSPTTTPTMLEMSEAKMHFWQEFSVSNGREFNEEELESIEVLYQGYTPLIAPPGLGTHNQVLASCTVQRQIEVPPPFLGDDSNPDAALSFKVDFVMRYQSRYIDVTSYPQAFQTYLNANLTNVMTQLQMLNLDVTQLGPASRIVITTPAPSQSTAPSASPTMLPSSSVDNLAPAMIPGTTGSGISNSSSYVPTSPHNQTNGVPSLKALSPPEETSAGKIVTIVVGLVIAALVAIIGIRLVAIRYGYCGGTSGRKKTAPHDDDDVEMNKKSSSNKKDTNTNDSSPYNGGTYNTAAMGDFDDVSLSSVDER